MSSARTATLCDLYERHGVKLGPLELLQAGSRPSGRIAIAPPSAREQFSGQDNEAPITSFASGWMRVLKRARSGGGDLPLIISDHADWTELTSTIEEISPQELWITHGEEAALMSWARQKGMPAQPLSIAGYGSDDDGEDA